MTTRIFNKTNTGKMAQRNGEAKHEQCGKAKKGLTVCKDCCNVFLKKSWHSAESNPDIQSKLSKKKINHIVCPACQMIEKNLYEGELIIEKVPKKYMEEVFNLIRAYEKRAKARDPQDRVSLIEKKSDGFRILTTENQLAEKMAKKIKETFKLVEVVMSFSKDPYKVCRVKAVFIQK